MNLLKLFENAVSLELLASLQLVTILSIITGLWGPAIILVILGFFQNNGSTCVILLTLAVALNGATYVGYNINHLDLSPNYASTLFGITNAMANIMSFIAPLVVGAVVTDEVSLQLLNHSNSFPTFLPEPAYTEYIELKNSY